MKLPEAAGLVLAFVARIAAVTVLEDRAFAERSGRSARVGARMSARATRLHAPDLRRIVESRRMRSVR